MDTDLKSPEPKTSSKLFSIGEASEYLGVSIDTLRRWEKRKKITALRSPGGHRYFSKDDLDNLFGRKYERAPETKPRQIAETIENIEKEQEIPQEEIIAEKELEMPIETPVIPPIPEILTREPREVNIPKIEPIKIIQTESFTQIQEITAIPQTSYMPEPILPVSMNENQSILTPPPEPIQPTVIPTPVKQPPPGKMPENYKAFIIAGAVILFMVLIVITYFLWKSSQQVLSPIP